MNNTQLTEIEHPGLHGKEDTGISAFLRPVDGAMLLSRALGILI
jgi:hypothetical protein